MQSVLLRVDTNYLYFNVFVVIFTFRTNFLRNKLDMKDLKNKVAIVTGSSSGVGAATARLLASLGCNLVINYNSNSTGADAVAGAGYVLVDCHWSAEAIGRRLAAALRACGYNVWVWVDAAADGSGHNNNGGQSGGEVQPPQVFKRISRLFFGCSLPSKRIRACFRRSGLRVR